MSRILLEICCDGLDEALAAERGGADRIELCSALALDGLTPSIGTVIEARERLAIPFVAMVRPHARGYRVTAAEWSSMLRDAELMLEAGAHGVVFGVLRHDRTVDRARCRDMVAIAAGRETVFHRAFDAAPDPAEALEALITAGVTRVLTSGGAPTALEGAELIGALVRQAAGRITILPGGGIREQNVGELIGRTGCTEVHLSRR